MQGDGFASKPRWDHGGGHVAFRTITTWPLMYHSLGPVPNHVVLVLGNLVFILDNEGVGPHHIQGRYTQSVWIGIRKLRKT